MYAIRLHFLEKEGYDPRLRMSLNNMLAWGVEVRKAYVKRVLVDIQKRVPKRKTWQSSRVSTRWSILLET